jgi:hypothetical protein
MSRASRAGPGLRQLTPGASLLLVAAAGAWIGVVLVAQDMGSMPGTMGLGAGSFTAVIAMAVLAGAVLAEKTWARGLGFSRVVGVAALVLAIAVVFVPGLAPGLHHAAGTGGMGGM